MVLAPGWTQDPISIHALLWSATFAGIGGVRLGLISIHALLWSATPPHYVLWLVLKISIHALLWSATTGTQCLIQSNNGFLSTHSCGVRR